MTDAKLTADRYVERGGYAPGERRERVPEDLIAVASFLAWHDKRHLHGGVHAGDAFLAFCRLVNFDAVELRKIVKGET